MATRDQQRAALAYDHVSAYVAKSKEERDKYKSIVHALAALVHTAGLCQALHFADSRSDKEQKEIVEHLAKQLNRVNPAISNGDALLDRARKAELSEYLQLTDEAMACLAWYRRLVQGLLKGDGNER